MCAREHVIRHTRGHRGLTQRGRTSTPATKKRVVLGLGVAELTCRKSNLWYSNSIRCDAAPHVATQGSMLQHGCPLGLGCKSCVACWRLHVGRCAFHVAFCQLHDACRVFHALHVAAKHAGGLFPSMHCMSAVVCCTLDVDNERGWLARQCVYCVPLSLKLSKSPSS